MSTSTPGLGLTLPAHGEHGWEYNINDNFTTIDTAITALQSSSGSASTISQAPTFIPAGPETTVHILQYPSTEPTIYSYIAGKEPGIPLCSIYRRVIPTVSSEYDQHVTAPWELTATIRDRDQNPNQKLFTLNPDQDIINTYAIDEFELYGGTKILVYSLATLKGSTFTPDMELEEISSSEDGGPSYRSEYGLAVTDNTIYIIGGKAQDGTLLNDVWKTQDCITWTQVTEHATWSPRYNLKAVAEVQYPTTVLLVYGGNGPDVTGYMGEEETGYSCGEVWFSSDEGETWIQMPDVPNSSNGRLNPAISIHTVPLIGGGYTHTGETLRDLYGAGETSWTQLENYGPTTSAIDQTIVYAYVTPEEEPGPVATTYEWITPKDNSNQEYKSILINDQTLALTPRPDLSTTDYILQNYTKNGFESFLYSLNSKFIYTSNLVIETHYYINSDNVIYNTNQTIHPHATLTTTIPVLRYLVQHDIASGSKLGIEATIICTGLPDAIINTYINDYWINSQSPTTSGETITISQTATGIRRGDIIEISVTLGPSSESISMECTAAITGSPLEIRPESINLADYTYYPAYQT